MSLRLAQNLFHGRASIEGNINRNHASSNTSLTCTQFMCHCHDDRKITGSLFTASWLVSESEFKVVQGTPKTYTKVADSGGHISSCFCGDCGSTLWRTTTSAPGYVVVKVGCVDDEAALENFVPDVEQFTKRRVHWQKEIIGAGQFEGAWVPQ